MDEENQVVAVRHLKYQSPCEGNANPSQFGFMPESDWVYRGTKPAGPSNMIDFCVVVLLRIFTLSSIKLANLGHSADLVRQILFVCVFAGLGSVCVSFVCVGLLCVSLVCVVCECVCVICGDPFAIDPQWVSQSYRILCYTDLIKNLVTFGLDPFGFFLMGSCSHLLALIPSYVNLTSRMVVLGSLTRRYLFCGLDYSGMVVRTLGYALLNKQIFICLASQWILNCCFGTDPTTLSGLLLVFPALCRAFLSVSIRSVVFFKTGTWIPLEFSFVVVDLNASFLGDVFLRLSCGQRLGSMVKCLFRLRVKILIIYLLLTTTMKIRRSDVHNMPCPRLFNDFRMVIFRSASLSFSPLEVDICRHLGLMSRLICGKKAKRKEETLSERSRSKNLKWRKIIFPVLFEGMRCRVIAEVNEPTEDFCLSVAIRGLQELGVSQVQTLDPNDFDASMTGQQTVLIAKNFGLKVVCIDAGSPGGALGTYSVDLVSTGVNWDFMKQAPHLLLLPERNDQYNFLPKWWEGDVGHVVAVRKCQVVKLTPVELSQSSVPLLEEPDLAISSPVLVPEPVAGFRFPPPPPVVRVAPLTIKQEEVGSLVPVTPILDVSDTVVNADYSVYAVPRGSLRRAIPPARRSTLVEEAVNEEFPAKTLNRSEFLSKILSLKNTPLLSFAKFDKGHCVLPTFDEVFFDYGSILQSIRDFYHNHKPELWFVTMTYNQMAERLGAIYPSHLIGLFLGDNQWKNVSYQTHGLVESRTGEVVATSVCTEKFHSRYDIFGVDTTFDVPGPIRTIFRWFGHDEDKIPERFHFGYERPWVTTHWLSVMKKEALVFVNCGPTHAYTAYQIWTDFSSNNPLRPVFSLWFSEDDVTDKTFDSFDFPAYEDQREGYRYSWEKVDLDVCVFEPEFVNYLMLAHVYNVESRMPTLRAFRPVKQRIFGKVQKLTPEMVPLEKHYHRSATPPGDFMARLCHPNICLGAHLTLNNAKTTGIHHSCIGLSERDCYNIINTLSKMRIEVRMSEALRMIMSSPSFQGDFAHLREYTKSVLHMTQLVSDGFRYDAGVDFGAQTQFCQPRVTIAPSVPLFNDREICGRKSKGLPVSEPMKSERQCKLCRGWAPSQWKWVKGYCERCFKRMEDPFVDKVSDLICHNEYIPVTDELQLKTVINWIVIPEGFGKTDLSTTYRNCIDWQRLYPRNILNNLRFAKLQKQSTLKNFTLLTKDILKNVCLESLKGKNVLIPVPLKQLSPKLYYDSVLFSRHFYVMGYSMYQASCLWSEFPVFTSRIQRILDHLTAHNKARIADNHVRVLFTDLPRLLDDVRPQCVDEVKVLLPDTPVLLSPVGVVEKPKPMVENVVQGEAEKGVNLGWRFRNVKKVKDLITKPAQLIGGVFTARARVLRISVETQEIALRTRMFAKPEVVPDLKPYKILFKMMTENGLLGKQDIFKEVGAIPFCRYDFSVQSSLAKDLVNLHVSRGRDGKTLSAALEDDLVVIKRNVDFLNERVWKVKDWSQPTWYETFEPRKRRKYLKAMLAYDPTRKPFIGFSLFIKREIGEHGCRINGYRPPANPRIICDPEAISQIICGPCLRRMTELMHRIWNTDAFCTYFGGLTPDQANSWVRSRVDNEFRFLKPDGSLASDFRVTENDFSKMDCTYSKAAFWFIEQVYKFWGLPMDSELFVHVLHEWMIPSGLFKNTGIEVFARLQNASGRADTSLMNGVLNGSTQTAAYIREFYSMRPLEDITYEEIQTFLATFRIAVAGDDSLTFCEYHEGMEERISQAVSLYGFETHDMKVWDDPRKCTFLGCHLYPTVEFDDDGVPLETISLGPTIGRRLYKMGASCDQQPDPLDWLHQVSEATALVSSFVPFVSDVAIRQMAWLDSKRFSRGNSNQRNHILEEMARYKVYGDLKPKIACPRRKFEFLESVYGLTREEVVGLEWSISQIPSFPCILNNVTIDRIVAQDTA